MGDELQKPHVVVVPYPAPGHLIPSIHFAKLLSSNGLAVTFVTTPGNVSFLHGSLLNDALDIRLVTLPTPAVEGLEGRERMDLLPPESRALITQMVEKLQHPFQTWMEEQFHQQTQTPAPPVCIVYDIFVSWAVDTAQKFNIASVLFNTCSAFASSLMQSMACSIFQNTLERVGEDGLVVSFNLPRPVRLSKHEVCPAFANADLSIPAQRFLNQCIQDIFGKGSGLLINTFHELEPFYLQHLKSFTAKPVWAIGPVNPQNFSSGAGNFNTRGKMVDMDEEELVCWLDSKSPRSVVYVSFGSLIVLSKEQAHALVTGLEASGQAFVWAIKMEPKSDDISTYLPEGFLERTKGRGLLIRGWAPQLVILSHPSVGAFISHCGWNSALESISLGVPILAWPMFYDQHFNSKLFVELGVGIQFCENVGGIPNEERVKEGVRIALSGEKGDEMRERAERLKEMAAKAIKEKGSSAADLTAFVSHMYNLNSKPAEDGREVESDLRNAGFIAE